MNLQIYLKNILKFKSNKSLKYFSLLPKFMTDTASSFKIQTSSYSLRSAINQQSGTGTSQNDYAAGASINADEHKKFQKLANEWWKENGEFEPLHRFNELRVPWIKNTLFNFNKESLIKKNESSKLITEPLLGLNILDVGCGGGLLSEPIARLGANVTGIDMVKDNVIVAQTHLETYANNSNDSKLINRIKYVNCAIEDLTLSEQNHGYFDAVLMSEVIEHVNNFDIFISNASKLLKPNGIAFVTTLSRTNCSYLTAILGAEYILGIVPKGTHDWNKFITPNELKLTLEKYNLFTKNLMGSVYNPLTKQWTWINNTSVNYALYAQKM